MALFGSSFYCCRVPSLRFKQSSRLLDDTRIEPCLHLWCGMMVMCVALTKLWPLQSQVQEFRFILHQFLCQVIIFGWYFLINGWVIWCILLMDQHLDGWIVMWTYYWIGPIYKNRSKHKIIAYMFVFGQNMHIHHLHQLLSSCNYATVNISLMLQYYKGI